MDLLNDLATFHNVSIDYLIGKTEMTNAEIERKQSIEPDIRVIQRAAMDMSPEQRKKAMDMWEILFNDVMNDAKKQEGLDDD